LAEPWIGDQRFVNVLRNWRYLIAIYFCGNR